MAGNEDPNKYLEEARQEGLFVQETLKKGKNFSFYLRTYGLGKEIHFQNSGFNMKADSAMYSGSDALDPKDNYYPKNIPKINYKKHTRVIYNLLKYLVGFSNINQITEKTSLTKLLTFCNIPGFLKVYPNDKSQQKIENQRRCLDGLNSIDFAYHLTGQTDDNRERKRGWGRFANYGKQTRRRGSRGSRKNRKGSFGSRTKRSKTIRKSSRNSWGKRPKRKTSKKRKTSYY